MLLASAAGGQTVLVYAPPGKTGAVALPATPVIPSRVELSFSVVSNRSGVRLLLLTEPQLQRWEQGQGTAVQAAAGWATEGRLSALVPGGTKLFVGVDNRLEGRSTAEVRVRYAVIALPQPRRAYGPDAGRAQVLVWAAGLLSGAVTLWSLWRIRRAFRRRDLLRQSTWIDLGDR